MFRPGFPRLSHPGLAHAAPSTGFMAKVYRGAGKLTDQQRAEQAPECVRVAHSGGVNFFFFYSLSHSSLVEALPP